MLSQRFPAKMFILEFWDNLTKIVQHKIDNGPYLKNLSGLYFFSKRILNFFVKVSRKNILAILVIMIANEYKSWMIIIFFRKMDDF